MRRVGMMQFTLKGQAMELAAFNEVGAPDMNHLTLMFSDMTSGTETYAAGRHRSERTASDIWQPRLQPRLSPVPLLQPGPTSAPIHPPKIALKVPIHAGERIKKAADAPVASR